MSDGTTHNIRLRHFTELLIQGPTVHMHVLMVRFRETTWLELLLDQQKVKIFMRHKLIFTLRSNKQRAHTFLALFTFYNEFVICLSYFC